jgi:ribosomal protein S18
MLVIFNEKKYKDFKKSRKKPSEFCKEDLHYPNVKSTAFVQDYFDDVDTLVRSITNYRRLSNIPNGEYSLLDLLTSIPN